MQTHTHQGMRCRQLITHQKNNCGCQSPGHGICSGLRAAGSRPIRPDASQHDLHFTDKSIYGRRANCQETRSVTHWDPRSTHAHTEWHDKPVNDLEGLGFCKNKIPQLLLSLIGGPTILHRDVWFHTCLQNMTPYLRLQADKSLLNFQRCDVVKSHYLKLQQVLCVSP